MRVSALLSTYVTERRKVNSAKTTVRNTVTALEMARDSIKGDLGMAGTYLNQLVALRQYEKDQADADVIAAGAAPPQFLIDEAKAKDTALVNAKDTLRKHNELGADGNPAGALVDALLETKAAKEDDGQALADAISAVHGSTVANKDSIDTLTSTLTDADGNLIDLANLDTGVDSLAGDGRTDETVKGNADNIMNLDGRVETNEEGISNLRLDLYGATAPQDGSDHCVAMGIANDAACGKERSKQNADAIGDLDSDVDGLSTRVDDNEDTLDDHAMKLMEKKSYIETLQAELGMDVAGNSGIEGSRIDHNETRSMDNATAIGENKTAIAANTTAIESNDMDIAANTTAIESNDMDIAANTTAIESNDMDIAANTTAIESNDMDIAANTTAIESNDMDIAANTTAIESNDMDIAANTTAIESNDVDIAANTTAIESNDMDIAANTTAIESNDVDIAANTAAIVAEATTRGEMDMMLATAIDDETTARMGADMMLAGALDEEVAARASADMALDSRVGSNAGAIAANMNAIGSNTSAISDNRNMIGELSDDLDVVRAGVAASMALAGMPAINGRGISIGVGSFDGESAFAVGFQIQGEQASFKVGITSGGGATGASAGVGFNF